MIDEEIYSSKCYKNYLDMCMEMKKYSGIDCIEPIEVTLKYKSALASYNDFLDENKVPIVKHKYPYDEKDKKTWKYIDVKISQNKKKCVWVENKEWIYR